MGIAKKQKDFWNGGDVDVLSEIVAEGNIGLLRAVDYFDYRRGFKFSTYATWAVRETIVRSRHARKKNDHRTMTCCDEFLFESIPDPCSLEEPQELSDRALIVRKVLEKIDGRQSKVLRDYFEHGLTLQAIALEMQISKERVRQIRDRGLKAVKSKLDSIKFVG